MPVNVLIADDEPVAREALRLFFGRNFPKCALFLAENGIEALKICSRQHIDLALIDIEMPGLTGLELMAALKKQRFEGQLLVVTAYSRFSYAQEAIGLGANAYILKPIQEHVLLPQISACLKKLDLSREACRARERIYECLADATHDVEADFWQSLSDRNAEQLEAVLDDAALGFSRIEGWLLQLRLGKGAPGALPAGQIERTLRFSLGGACVARANSQFRIYLDGSSQDGAQSAWAPYRIAAMCKRCGYPRAQLWISGPISGAPALMRAAAANVFFPADGPCVLFERGGAFLPPDRAISWQNRLLRAALGGAERQESALRALKQAYEGPWRGREVEATEAIAHILMRIALKLLDAKSVEATIEELIRLATSEESALEIPGEMLRALAWRLGSGDFEDAAAAVERAISFMREHLSEPISLSNTAEHAGLSEYHFSRVFSRVTGSKYVDYLTELRIERAKSLLATVDLPLSELSRLCGYQSTSYFCTVFKRQTGYKVREYKRLQQPDALPNGLREEKLEKKREERRREKRKEQTRPQDATDAANGECPQGMD